MNTQDEIHDSPAGWVAQHIHNYVESDGENGHLWRGVPTLLLTTRGRKSGLLRRTALIYGQDGDNYVIVASRGGDQNHPSWYLNLVEVPTVEIQVGADKFEAQAHTATPEEKARLWPLMTSIWPDYNNYQAKTDREIPVVVLTPVS
ncbi:MAG: nitroreductase family deazaflavin-dependent oxidoreductase [Anaerolineae bacterium]|nr:nitroreductase family deazaflavin-dependent oxidoreductase [Anaerolineae bacterium]